MRFIIGGSSGPLTTSGKSWIRHCLSNEDATVHEVPESVKIHQRSRGCHCFKKRIDTHARLRQYRGQVSTIAHCLRPVANGADLSTQLVEHTFF